MKEVKDRKKNTAALNKKLNRANTKIKTIKIKLTLCNERLRK